MLCCCLEGDHSALLSSSSPPLSIGSERERERETEKEEESESEREGEKIRGEEAEGERVAAVVEGAELIFLGERNKRQSQEAVAALVCRIYPSLVLFFFLPLVFLLALGPASFYISLSSCPVVSLGVRLCGVHERRSHGKRAPRFAAQKRTASA